MYIRRKVFSLIEDVYGDERYFSTTEFDLDEERYFSEGEYEYDERYYSDEDSHVGRNIAIGTGATVGGAAALAGGYQGVRHIQKAHNVKKATKALENEREQLQSDIRKGLFVGKKARAAKARLAELEGAIELAGADNKVDSFGKKMEGKVKDGSKKAWEATSDFGKKVAGKTKEGAQKAWKATSEFGRDYWAGERNGAKYGMGKTGNRVAAIGTASAAALGTGAAVYAHHKKKDRD